MKKSGKKGHQGTKGNGLLRVLVLVAAIAFFAYVVVCGLGKNHCKGEE